jgi:hypothetical protein
MILEIFIGFSCLALVYSTLRTLNLYRPKTLKEFIFGEVGSLLMFTAMTYAAVITLGCMALGKPVPDIMNLYLVESSK